MAQGAGGLGKLLGEVEVTVAEGEFVVEVVYVQPVNGGEGESCIDFEEFALYVDGCGDEVSRAFAKSLRKWVGVAGVESPT